MTPTKEDFDNLDPHDFMDLVQAEAAARRAAIPAPPKQSWMNWFRGWATLTERTRNTLEHRQDELHWLKERVASLEGKVSRLEAHDISQKLEKIMATSAEALAAMRASNDKADSLIIWAKDIKAQLDDVLSGVKLPQGVQADIDAIFTEANSQAQENVDAIVVNTPPDPVPVP